MNDGKSLKDSVQRWSYRSDIRYECPDCESIGIKYMGVSEEEDGELYNCEKCDILFVINDPSYT